MTEEKKRFRVQMLGNGSAVYSVPAVSLCPAQMNVTLASPYVSVTHRIFLPFTRH